MGTVRSEKKVRRDVDVTIYRTPVKFDDVPSLEGPGPDTWSSIGDEVSHIVASLAQLRGPKP